MKKIIFIILLFLLAGCKNNFEYITIEVEVIGKEEVIGNGLFTENRARFVLFYNKEYGEMSYRIWKQGEYLLYEKGQKYSLCISVGGHGWREGSEIVILGYDDMAVKQIRRLLNE